MDLPAAECGTGYFKVPDPSSEFDIENSLVVQMIALSGYMHGMVRSDLNDLAMVKCRAVLADESYELTNYCVDLDGFKITYEFRNSDDNVSYTIVLYETEEGTIQFLPNTPVMVLERIRTLIAEGTWELING